MFVVVCFVYSILLCGDQHVSHGRRITTEEKAKVVAAVWSTECIQFLAALAIHIILVLNS